MTTLIATAAGGTRNWTDSATWSPAQVPTAADDCVLELASGPVTINTGSVARSLNCTSGTGSYTGTLTHTSNVTLTLGDATAGAGNVALKLSAGMTYTRGNDASGISYSSTSATQQTIATAGKVMGNFAIAGAGCSYIQADASLLTVTGTMFHQAGTFNTGNFACQWGLMTIQTANVKTLTLGSSAIAITGNSAAAVNHSGSNATFTANTAVFTLSGVASGFAAGANNWNGASLVFTSAVSAAGVSGAATFNNLTITGPVSKVGVFTFSSLVTTTFTGTVTINGNSTVNRLLVSSATVGSLSTVSVGTAFALSNTDFRDLAAAGAAGTWTGTSMGNALGNSNITFDAPATQTRSGAGGNWSTAGNWTSRVPLPQDNVIINAGASGTITADMPRLGADVDFTGFAGTAALGVAVSSYGSLNLATGMTLSGAFTWTLSARSSKTITSNGKAFSNAVSITAPGGTYTLVDAISMGVNTFTAAAGTLDTGSLGVTAGIFAVSSGATATLGTSTLTITSTSALSVVSVSATSTLSAASATFVVSTTSANARTFAGGGKTYGTLTYTVAGSTGSLTITGSNTFNTINFSDVTNARSLLFTAATTTTVTNWNVNGTAGKLMTIASATAATHNLSKPTGVIAADYLNITNSLAGGGAYWYAGANSVDGGGNTGWKFTADKQAESNFFLMFGSV